MHFSENVPRVHYLLLYGAHWRLLLSGVALWNRRGVTVHPWQPHAKSRDHPLFLLEQLLCCEPKTICGASPVCHQAESYRDGQTPGLVLGFCRGLCVVCP